MKIALFSHFSAGSDMPVHKKLAVFVEKLFLKNNCIKRPNFLLVVEAIWWKPFLFSSSLENYLRARAGFSLTLT